MAGEIMGVIGGGELRVAGRGWKKGAGVKGEETGLWEGALVFQCFGGAPTIQYLS